MILTFMYIKTKAKLYTSPIIMQMHRTWEKLFENAQETHVPRFINLARNMVLAIINTIIKNLPIFDL